jgi:hypothetical protein
MKTSETREWAGREEEGEEEGRDEEHKEYRCKYSFTFSLLAVIEQSNWKQKGKHSHVVELSEKHEA